MLAAGAIEFNETQNKYVRVVEPEGVDAITRAVQRLAVGKEPGHDTREWFVSAPGKVILFGEHAVVHGVVSFLLVRTSLLGTSSGYAMDWISYTLCTPKSAIWG